MKQILLLILFLCTFCIVRAQTDDITTAIDQTQFQAKQVIPPSPIAAELGKYGNVPVSLFTGTPSVSIPLFEVKGNLLSLPISLSNNSSGYKPQDLATWVGSSWSLNAGGVITRSVMGNPDISSNYFNAPYSLIPPNNLSVIPYYQYMKNIQTGVLETQPDVYYYNFGGYTGKFILNPDQTVVKKKKDMLVITSGILATNSYFTIQDEHGNLYTFSDVETTTSQPNDAAGMPNNTRYVYPSSWFLTKIQTADNNEEIDFTYTATSGTTMYPNNSNNQTTSYDFPTNNISLHCASGSVTGSSSVSATTSITMKYLQKITLSKGGQELCHVDFIPTVSRLDSDGGDRVLSQVNVYTPGIPGAGYKLIKRYNLTYSYFSNTGNTGTGADKYRLRLDALQEMSVNGTTASKPAYQFTYNTFGGLPQRFTMSLDHWGFYNASGNTTLIPTVYEFGYLGNSVNVGLTANREPDLNAASFATLSKIQYPSGGYTTFDYELNQGKDATDGTVHSVGGVRVRTVTDFSGTSQQATVKQYTYQLDDGSTSGVVNFPTYPLLSYSNHYNEPCPLGGPGGGSPCGPCLATFGPFTHTRYSVNTSSIYGLGSFQGSHIGYTQVTEMQTDAITAQPLGKTVYKYNMNLGGIAFNDGHDDDISNGDLNEESHYDNTGKLIKDITNTYTYTNLAVTHAYLVKTAQTQTNHDYYYLMPDGSYTIQFFWETEPSGYVAKQEFTTQLFTDQYDMTAQYGYLSQRTEKTYDQFTNSYKTQTENFVYGNPLHIYPTLTTISTTGSTQLITQKKYAGDYSYTGITSDVAANAIVNLNNDNMLGTEIETVQYRQNSDGSNKRYINGSLTTYISNPIPTPDKVYRIESVTPLTSLTASAINGSGVFTYDTHYKIAGSYKFLNNNLIEQSKDGGPVSAYLWDYNQLEPVAAITNSNIANIAYTSFETASTLTGNWVAHTVLLDTTTSFTGRVSGVLSSGSKLDATFTTAPPQSIVSYWASGPATVMSNTTTAVPVSSTGLTTNGWTYYEHLLPAGTTQVELTGSIHIDELKLYPQLAQMQTETYDPFIGTTSQVSPSNQVLRYQYDGLNRLTTIKDVYGNIKQNFVYNYGPGVTVTAPTQTLFYNAMQQQSFTKNNCTAGSGTTVNYVIPYGKYAAATQTAADALATQDMSANGQNYANANGQCLFYNDQAYSQAFFKNDCDPTQGLGSHVTYTVAVGTVSSTISIADADSQAQAMVTANGQAYANSHGTCSCALEGEKYINGNCETGTKIYISSTPSNGHYICVYEYQFSDGTYSQTYTVNSPTNCVNN